MENQEVTVLKWFLGTEISILFQFLITLNIFIGLFINAISMQIIFVQKIILLLKYWDLKLLK